MNDELKAAAERNMSSYYNRMIDATVTHGMLIFCDHRKAHELAREADAEIEGLRKDAERMAAIRRLATHHGAPSRAHPFMDGFWWNIAVPYVPGEHKTLDDAIDAAIDAAKGAGDE